jgi:uncharacterized paraquat-inducible protein A
MMDLLGASCGPVVMFAILAISACYYHSRYEKYPDFEEYKRTHPDKVRNGRVVCHICGGSRIQMRGLDAAVDRRKTHSCVTCGTTLYPSFHWARFLGGRCER